MTERRLIVVAHYDGAGRLGKDLLGCLQRLLALPSTDVVLVSTGLDPSPYAALLAGLRIIVRENHGYDFYSWRAGLLSSDLTRYAEVLLFNSSFYVLDQQKFIDLVARPGDIDAEMRGLTVSWEKAFHAQSYYLTFSPRVVASESFGRFWSEMTPLSRRQEVIRKYEIGLSRTLSAHFRIESIFEPTELERAVMLERYLRAYPPRSRWSLTPTYARYRTRLNPSLLLWDSIAERYGIVKKQLVSENPHGLDITELRRRVEDVVGQA